MPSALGRTVARHAAYGRTAWASFSDTVCGGASQTPSGLSVPSRGRARHAPRMSTPAHSCSPRLKSWLARPRLERPSPRPEPGRSRGTYGARVDFVADGNGGNLRSLDGRDRVQALGWSPNN